MKQYLMFMGFQALARQVIKGALRVNPKVHAQTIAVEEYRLGLEKDLYRRLHPEDPLD